MVICSLGFLSHAVAKNAEHAFRKPCLTRRNISTRTRDILLPMYPRTNLNQILLVLRIQGSTLHEVTHSSPRNIRFELPFRSASLPPSGLIQTISASPLICLGTMTHPNSSHTHTDSKHACCLNLSTTGCS
jgi:hypothetical protein